MDKNPSRSQSAGLLTAPVTYREWLTTDTFEIRLKRPPGFDFIPGQKVKLVYEQIERNYSLISSPQDREVAICVRLIPQGRMSPILAAARIGHTFCFTAAFGFFVFQPSGRPAVFVATGTGIAPFVAFVRSGVRGFRLLHGARRSEDLYYKDLLAPAADAYIACLSNNRKPSKGPEQVFQGRVTSYLEQKLPSARYDFYLCGSSEMVRAVMGVVDDHYPESRVFTETFY